jgi:PAS domain S-box-containing protein
MKIKTKLQLIIIVNILILAGIVCFSLLWQKQAEDLIEQNAMISELQEVIFERARLREEYFLHRTARAKTQFLLIHKEIGGRLERMTKAFHDPEEKASLDGMVVAHLRIGHLFDRLIRLDEGTGDRPAGTQALRERIIGQMLIQAHAMYRDGAKLLKAANEKTAIQNDRDRLYGYITFGLLALLIGAFAVIIIRNIAYPLTRLQEGTEMIARGNLSYKTDLKGRDEIGRLSAAFDLMTENLKKITVSRDELNKEIEGRKRKEAELRAVFSYQKSLLSAIPDIIMEVDGNKVYTWANQPGRDFFGEDVVGREAAFFFEGDQDTYSTVQPLFNGHENVIHLESWQRRRDGEKRLLSWQCRVLKDENGQVTGALSSARDITARKAMQEALRASEEKYRLLAENSADIVWILDFKKQKFTYVNPSVESIRGYTPEEALELPLDKILTPDSYKRAMEILKEVLAGDPRGFKDPKNIPAFEFQEFCKDGSVIDTETRMRFILNAKGRPVGVQGITRDVTERKRAEEEIRRLNAELEQRVIDRTAKLEAVNRELEAFSYSVSHDLRGPLRAIDGFSRILLEDYGERLDAEGRRLFNVIRTNTQHMDQLITDLLSLSRVSKNELNLSRIDMTAMARSIYHEIASPEVQQKFVFTVAPLPDGCGDSNLLRQVWSNLLSNAIKYTIPREERRIEITAHTEGGMNVYSVRDTGVGFNPAYAHKLFGVFQRLHKSSEFEGNGVGLAIVQRIVHRHGGRVRAEGNLNEGAVFSFSLPCKEVPDE